MIKSLKIETYYPPSSQIREEGFTSSITFSSFSEDIQEIYDSLSEDSPNLIEFKNIIGRLIGIADISFKVGSRLPSKKDLEKKEKPCTDFSNGLELSARKIIINKGVK